MKLYENFKNFLKEIDIDFSKFKIQDNLEPNLWTDEKIDYQIKEKLIKIARDFFDKLNVSAEIDDIIITGSSAGYNWHTLSDIDLHILVDFTKVNGKEEITKGFFDAKRSLWNKTHDILVAGHEVEIYVQDTNEEHFSSGMYSLMKDEWIKFPKREEFEIKEQEIQQKAEGIAKDIEYMQKLYKDKEYRDSYAFSLKLAEKIKNLRRTGLESKGIYSIENLAFKALRNHGYLERLSTYRNLSYDKMMSVNKQEKLINLRVERGG
jgi:hypothetical protein